MVLHGHADRREAIVAENQRGHRVRQRPKGADRNRSHWRKGLKVRLLDIGLTYQRGQLLHLGSQPDIVVDGHILLASKTVNLFLQNANLRILLVRVRPHQECLPYVVGVLLRRSLGRPAWRRPNAATDAWKEGRSAGDSRVFLRRRNDRTELLR